jgi:hypothetical protein
MYIPARSRAFCAGPASAAAQVGLDLAPKQSVVDSDLQRSTGPRNFGGGYTALEIKDAILGLWRAIVRSWESHAILGKRDTVQSTNTTIGVVVGVLLAVFFVGAIYFCIRYRTSIRLSKKKKPRHRRSGGSSKGSNASQASDAPPAPPPPPPPPPAEG